MVRSLGDICNTLTAKINSHSTHVGKTLQFQEDGKNQIATTWTTNQKTHPNNVVYFKNTN